MRRFPFHFLLDPQPARRLLPTLALAVVTGAGASAQLDLPSSSPRTRSPSRPGLELPRRERGDLAPRPEGDRLLVPARPGDAPAVVQGAHGALGSPVPVLNGEEALPEAARRASALLEGIASGPMSSTQVERGVESLVGLGAEGLAAARAALARPELAVVACSARVLLRAGEAADRGAIAERLRRRLGGGMGPALLAELLAADPVVVSTSYLAALLDHPESGMRHAARRALGESRDPALHVLLLDAAASPRTETREHALGLLAGLDDPAVPRILLRHLEDPSSRVAGLAVRLLVERGGDEVTASLLERAFARSRVDGGGDPAGDRAGALALLALCDLEDRTRSPVLTDDHVPALLPWLRSPAEIVAGASAAALAGIGFRSPRSRELDFLDLEVPHVLVRVLSGETFFGDFAILREPALRRLRLLGGEDCGGDGRAIVSWWTAEAGRFQARRARLEVLPDEVASIGITWKGEGQEVRLVGPARPLPPGSSGSPGRVFRLGEAEVRALFEVLEREGVFGPERLPGAAGPGSELFEVEVGGRRKRFEARAGDEPWLATVVAAVREVAEHNRWQLYRDPRRHATQAEFLADEASFFESETDPLARQRRFKDLLLAWLDSGQSARDAQRSAGGLADLESLYAVEGVPQPGDLPLLMRLLETTPYLDARARSVVEMALRSARSASDSGAIGLEHARGIAGILAQRFGDDAEDALVLILRESGGGLLDEFLAQGDALHRRAVARSLAGGPPGEQDGAGGALERLMALLEDPDESVERAATEALGRIGAGGAEEARTELLVRARVAPAPVRSAALRALASMGGEGVFDVLVVALADGDPRVKKAGVEGLAELADPAGAALLAPILARGPESELFEPARRGLLALGEDAHAPLLRLTLSGAESTRREAALLLSEAGVAEAASTLILILTENPSDGRVAAELAVLTGVDHREAADPAQEWWGFWDLVVHDDSLVWFCAAADRAGFTAPGPDLLRGPGTAEGARFCLEVLARGERHLAERARRELTRILGGDLGSVPPRGAAREPWMRDLSERIERAFDEAR